jgi:hypothetical protein
MANGNGQPMPDAALQVRVRNLSDDVHSLRGEMRDIKTAIDAIATQQNKQGQPQWQALGVMLTAVVIVGGLAWWPIREASMDMQTTLRALMERSVTQRQHDADLARVSSGINDARQALELLRVRSYEQHGNVAKLEAENKNQDGRIDAISRRLAEFIRDMGKH